MVPYLVEVYLVIVIENNRYIVYKEDTKLRFECYLRMFLKYLACGRERPFEKLIYNYLLLTIYVIAKIIYTKLLGCIRLDTAST